MPNSKREDQLKFLERRWQLLDSTKGARWQVPLLIGALIAGLTNLAYTSDTFAASVDHRITALLNLALTIVGLCITHAVHRQYTYVCDCIAHLYAKLEMCGEEFLPRQLENDEEHGKSIWFWTYALIALVGLSCTIAVLFLTPNAG